MLARKTLSAVALLAGLSWAALISNALADPAATEKGRYAMTPVEGGFMRLDTETGAVALCTRKGETWACEPVNDKSATSEDASKLEAENKALKERLKNLEAGTPPNPVPEGPPGGITKLPTEKEVDEALDYVERMYKKFRDRLQKIEPAPTTPAPKPGDNGPGTL
jgi:hypothetical protein